MRAVPLRRLAVGLPAAALAAIGLGLALWLSLAPEPEGTPAGPEAAVASGPTHPLLFFDGRAFAAAAAGTAAAPIQPMPDARGLLLPHHWVGGAFITTPLRDLAASRDVRRVILIGPNHTNAGGAAVLTSHWSWETPFGRVEPDRLALTPLAVVNQPPA